MKIVKFSIILVAAVAAIIGLSATSYAFHDGGVARCGGCHSMHAAVGSYLMTGADASSTCLNCHESEGDTGPRSYHISTHANDAPAGVAPLQMSPGGDFGWLKKTYTYSAHGRPGTELGERHGHNIVAPSLGYVADVQNATAPGGTFNSNNLGCTSCHDQHGQVRRLTDATFALTGAPIIASGSYNNSPAPAAGEAVGTYRLLRSNLSDAGTFANTPVVAWAPSSYNRSEDTTMTRVEYNNSMSDYCGSCHGDMHTTAGVLRHVTGVGMSGTVLGNYNTYVKSGDMSGAAASAYLSLVPFEQGQAVNVANIATLQANAVNDDSVLAGPMATAQVMCLTCHRAHATAFTEMTRWEMGSEFITENSAYPSVHGKSTTETLAAYYNKDVTKFATYQRSLCNKCHAKD